MGGSGELSVSGDVSSYIKNLFDSAGYTNFFDFWGTRDQQTQPNTVYNYAEWATRFRDTTVILYKGHSLPVTCPISCGNDHYGVYDCEGYNITGGETIKDYEIYNKIYDEGYGSHDFVFLWTCGAGDPSRLGSTSGSHGWGMCASWMGINNAATSLSDDGYDDPDGNDRCFIGFDYLSIWYTNSTNYSNWNYGHFIYYFYMHALQQYWTINMALDAASELTHGDDVLYEDTPLYGGYSIWDPRETPPVSVDSAMHVWGDGNLTIR